MYMFTRPTIGMGFTIMSVKGSLWSHMFLATSIWQTFSPNHWVDSSLCISVTCLAYALRGSPVSQGVMLAGVMTLGNDVDRRWGQGYLIMYIWCAAQWEEPHGYSPTERRPVFIRTNGSGRFSMRGTIEFGYFAYGVQPKITVLVENGVRREVKPLIAVVRFSRASFSARILDANSGA